MKRFYIEVYTNWCGEQQEYVAYANDIEEFENIVASEAYENFSSFDGFSAILEELYPNVDDGEYTEDMIDHAIEVEGEYYGYTIEEWNGSDEEWTGYELIYDGRK